MFIVPCYSCEFLSDQVCPLCMSQDYFHCQQSDCRAWLVPGLWPEAATYRFAAGAPANIQGTSATALLSPSSAANTVRQTKVTAENASFAYSLSIDSRFSSVRFLRIVLICNPQALKRDFGPGAAPMRCLMTFEIKIQRSAVLPLELAHRFAHQSWECKDVAFNFRCCFACLR